MNRFTPDIKPYAHRVGDRVMVVDWRACGFVTARFSNGRALRGYRVELDTGREVVANEEALVPSIVRVPTCDVSPCEVER
jgi:hypothetical protein